MYERDINENVQKIRFTNTVSDKKGDDQTKKKKMKNNYFFPFLFCFRREKYYVTCRGGFEQRRSSHLLSHLWQCMNRPLRDETLDCTCHQESGHQVLRFCSISAIWIGIQECERGLREGKGSIRRRAEEKREKLNLRQRKRSERRWMGDGEREIQ